MMNCFDSLDIAPTSNIFSIDEFYSSLRNSVITVEEHASVKKNFTSCWRCEIWEI